MSRRTARPARSSSAGWPISAETGSCSTHKLALSLSGKFLEAAGKKAYLLGHRPRRHRFRRGIHARGRTEPPISVRDAIIDADRRKPPGVPS
ncbi:MAG: hypothetical protein M0C28_07590 [Candidatus Moduliflexus flocculans]|nr:hypothetical protein [Candidatus Moduliflexus flocculans]